MNVKPPRRTLESPISYAVNMLSTSAASRPCGDDSRTPGAISRNGVTVTVLPTNTVIEEHTAVTRTAAPYYADDAARVAPVSDTVRRWQQHEISGAEALMFTGFTVLGVAFVIASHRHVSDPRLPVMQPVRWAR